MIPLFGKVARYMSSSRMLRFLMWFICNLMSLRGKKLKRDSLKRNMVKLGDKKSTFKGLGSKGTV